MYADVYIVPTLEAQGSSQGREYPEEKAKEKCAAWSTAAPAADAICQPRGGLEGSQLGPPRAAVRAWSGEKGVPGGTAPP
jgi:hypothetical protein